MIPVMWPARALAVFALAIGATMVGACDVAQQDDGGTGGEAASSCDGSNDCAACAQCAAQVDCASQLSACNASSACVAIDECVTVCGADLACKSDCVNNNPGGASTYEAAARCVYCTSCTGDCAGFRTCD
jgi:hypothetical protein